MSLSSRIQQGRGATVHAAGSTPGRARRLYRCHYCGLADPDPEVVFDHMNRRDCQPPAPVSPWVQKARERTLPSKALS